MPGPRVGMWPADFKTAESRWQRRGGSSSELFSLPQLAAAGKLSFSGSLCGQPKIRSEYFLTLSIYNDDNITSDAPTRCQKNQQNHGSRSS